METKLEKGIKCRKNLTHFRLGFEGGLSNTATY